jgi:hypothetical protein
MLFMDPKPQSSGRRVLLAGIVAGIMAGIMAGSSVSCSKPGAATIDLKKAKAALSKRRADYGEAPRIQSSTRDQIPAQHK